MRLFLLGVLMIVSAPAHAVDQLWRGLQSRMTAEEVAREMSTWPDVASVKLKPKSKEPVRFSTRGLGLKLGEYEFEGKLLWTNDRKLESLMLSRDECVSSNSMIAKQIMAALQQKMGAPKTVGEIYGDEIVRWISYFDQSAGTVVWLNERRYIPGDSPSYGGGFLGALSSIGNALVRDHCSADNGVYSILTVRYSSLADFNRARHEASDKFDKLKDAL